ncbi:hypothetical protein Tsubulata_047137, partial [Turnera subulata]
ENVSCVSKPNDVAIRLEKHNNEKSSPGEEYLDSKLVNHHRRNSFGEVIVSLYHTHLRFFVVNVNCRSKVTGMVVRPEKYGKERSGNPPHREWLDDKLTPETRHSIAQVVMSKCNTRAQYEELSIGDPTRNIVSLIFQRALTNPSNPSRNLKRILKVRNSIEILERYERYREKVKKNAYEHHKLDPRSAVDGNELLRFYGTTMSCCRRKSKQISELCRDPACQVCRMIESNFHTQRTKENGIRLSTDSEEISDTTITLSRLKKVERAVIVCRVIAGIVDSQVKSMMYEGCNSVGGKSLIVRNPCAVLPCFVIVFS